MITFVPSWQGVSSGEVSTDDLIGPIQSFHASQESYRIVVSDYLPHLRYFLHRFGLLESEYVSLFDQLQGFEGRFQEALRLEDLDFPDTVSYTYTPFSVLVYQEGIQIGEVVMREGAHISEVKHFQDAQLIFIEVYDDRGFLSSRQLFENGEHVSTEYLDAFGQRIFLHFQKEGECLINVANKKSLIRDYYPSLDALIFELLEAEFQRVDDSCIMVAVHDRNRQTLIRSLFLDRMVLSYFDHRVSMKRDFQLIDRFLLTKARAVVADTDTLYQVLSTLTEDIKKVYKISPFDTRFSLSASQEMKEEVLYFDLRQTGIEDNQEIILRTFDFVREKILEDDARRFKIIVRAVASQVSYLEDYYLQLVMDDFPEEMMLLEEIEREGEGENTLNALLLGEMKQRVASVKALRDGFEVFGVVKDDVLFKVLHETRLILDLSPHPDLFTQIAGISSGIPQINRIETDYVQMHKNGWISPDLEQLHQAMSYYLDSLKHWQEARATSVQQIKRFSGIALCHKVLTLFEREIHE